MTEEELFRKLGGFNPINNFGAPKENIAINPCIISCDIGAAVFTKILRI